MDELFLKICAGLAVVLLFMTWLEIRVLSRKVSVMSTDRKLKDRRSDVEIWLYQINENVEKMATVMERSEKPAEDIVADDNDVH